MPPWKSEPTLRALETDGPGVAHSGEKKGLLASGKNFGKILRYDATPDRGQLEFLLFLARGVSSLTRQGPALDAHPCISYFIQVLTAQVVFKPA